MSELATAAQTGASEASTPAPASSPAPEATSAPAADKSAAPESSDRPLSSRDAIRRAMDTVNSRPPNETEKAIAALREGAGADERLATERATNAEQAEASSEASERAKAGWETRRANAEKARLEAEAALRGETAKAETPKAAETPAQPVAKAAEPSKNEPSKYEPPARLAPEAKALWKDAPEAVRAEVVRMHDELTAGLTKHKEAADRYAPLADYEKRSQEVYKQPLADTLKNYVELDELLASDPLAGLERIVGSMTYEGEDGQTHNWTLKQMAEYISQQDKDTFTSESSELKLELAAVKRELAEIKNGYTTTQKTEAERRTSSIEKQVQEFATANPRFDELYADMEMILASPKFQRTGDVVADLKKAYEKAERLNPAPSLSPPAPDIPAPDRAAQTRAGQASVSGAPGAGSNPGRKPVPQTNRDAIKRAFGALGISSS